MKWFLSGSCVFEILFRSGGIETALYFTLLLAASVVLCLVVRSALLVGEKTRELERIEGGEGSLCVCVCVSGKEREVLSETAM